MSVDLLFLIIWVKIIIGDNLCLEYCSKFNNCLKIHNYLYCVNYFGIDEHSNQNYDYNIAKYFHKSI